MLDKLFCLNNGSFCNAAIVIPFKYGCRINDTVYKRVSQISTSPKMNVLYLEAFPLFNAYSKYFIYTLNYCLMYWNTFNACWIICLITTFLWNEFYIVFFLLSTNICLKLNSRLLLFVRWLSICKLSFENDKLTYRKYSQYKCQWHILANKNLV